MRMEPYDFYYGEQPHGTKAKLWISDDLNGSRYVVVNKVTREHPTGEFWAVIGDKRVSMAHKTLEVPDPRHGRLPPVVEETFTSFDVGMLEGLSNIDYKTDLSQFDSFREEFSTGKVIEALESSAAGILRDAESRKADGKTYPNPYWLGRVEVIGKLASIIQMVEKANYTGAADMLRDCEETVERFNNETKRVLGV